MPADRTRGRLLGAAAILVLALAGVSACSDEPKPQSEGAIETYVALGDSFTAAPYVPKTDLARGCLRSNGNYPSLLAEHLDTRLTDVSCSGADTEDLTGRQVTLGVGARIAPQLDAVKPDTDLITVGIGGNDFHLYGTLVARCTTFAARSGTPCDDALNGLLADPSEVLARLRYRVFSALQAVHEAAPDATMVLVGYPRLTRPSGDCPKFPLAPGDRRLTAALEQSLDQTLKQAAARAGALYVDMYAVSQGHEICSADPWVNGRQTDTSKALAYHPFAAEQEAVAEQIRTVLPDS